MVSKMNGLKEAVEQNISGFEGLQEGVQRDKMAAGKLLAQGQAARQVLEDCGNTVGH